MTNEEAAAKMQAALVEMNRILNEDVIPLAREYKIEFQFLDMQYRLFPRGRDTAMEIWNRTTRTYRYVPRPPAPTGLLVSDDEWESSSFGCSSRYWSWHEKSWPEIQEGEETDDES